MMHAASRQALADLRPKVDGVVRRFSSTDGLTTLADELHAVTALLTGQDGRQALLAFTSLDTLHAWRADARPVPVTASLAARSAQQEGAAALVLDVAGPTTYVVEGELLEGLARGWTLAHTTEGLAWVETR